MKKIILMSLLAFTALTTYGIISYYQHQGDLDIAKLYEPREVEKIAASSTVEESTKEQVDTRTLSGKQHAKVEEKKTTKKASPKKYRNSTRDSKENKGLKQKTVTTEPVDVIETPVMESEERTTAKLKASEKEVPLSSIKPEHNEKKTVKKKEKVRSTKKPRELKFSKFSRAAPVDYEAVIVPAATVSEIDPKPDSTTDKE